MQKENGDNGEKRKSTTAENIVIPAKYGDQLDPSIAGFVMHAFIDLITTARGLEHASRYGTTNISLASS